jgi:hypothetical protein
MFRIEFVDDGILRECNTDNSFTAAVLFDNLQRSYTQVYWYRINLSGEEELFQFYNSNQIAA